MTLFFAVMLFGSVIPLHAADKQVSSSEKFINLNGAYLEAESPEWFICEVDEDCINISYPCAGSTVNKKFGKQAKYFYGNQNAARDCVLLPLPKGAPPFKVFCKDKKCGSQGRNPKMGFS